jgi:hypothetical protein
MRIIVKHIKIKSLLMLYRMAGIFSLSMGASTIIEVGYEDATFYGQYNNGQDVYEMVNGVLR